jgi:SpoVK/Ycf46/Vps4 family AAA+-type ATPase
MITSNYTTQARTQKPVRPAWVEDLLTFYKGRIARQFVLHFNLTDYIIDLNERRDIEKGAFIRTGDVVGNLDTPAMLRQYLYQFLFDELSCRYIYTYSLANGLTADDVPPNAQDATNRPQDGKAGNVRLSAANNSTNSYEGYRPGPGTQLLHTVYREMHSTGQQRNNPAQGEQEIELPNEVSENLKLLSRVLQQPYFDAADPNSETPVAVVLDYAEKLIPYHLGEGQGDREQLQALEVVQRWAIDPQIRKTQNIIILLTTNIGLIPSSVYAEGSGCRAIRIPLPDEHEREAFIRFKIERASIRLIPFAPNDFGLVQAEQAHRLARATQGMRLSDIDNMSRRVAAEFKKRKEDQRVTQGVTPLLRTEDVQKVKAEVIQAQSAELLEIVPPVRGFNEIGGLENLKQYLSKRAKLMISGQFSPLVPSGLLLAGPPGTGKTTIAEALATESGFNLVKMRNIQDKWVGSSERNLELVINLLKDLHPVVVFIDEIDQAMVRRDTGQSGDSGVGARMFARLLEEMSNPTNRGQILWVAATNRADIIDAALLRRFDRVVPLLTPDVPESCRIFATMINTIVKQSKGNIQVAYGGDLAQSTSINYQGSPNPVDLDKFIPAAEITCKLGLTGAGIEIVVRRAIEIVYEEMIDRQLMPMPNQVPLIELRHLLQAVQDYKPNHNREVYDYQSLLAIRACNFHSVIPVLPKSGVYGRIQKPDGTIDIEKLDQEIRNIEQHNRLRA